MRRRTLTTLTLFAALALMLGWLPNSSWLRGVLGSLLVDSAAAANATLSFGAISGYAWRGLTLAEARLVTDGLDVTATSVSVDWFLPALVVGELPLRLDVVGLAGDVEVGRLNLPLAGGEPPAVQVRIDGARLDVADLRIAEVPFDLPDLRIERLEATSGDDGRWELSTVLATAEGRVEGTVRGRLGDDAFEVTLERGDARVARHWWDGIEAGTLSGELTVAAGHASGRFEVEGGAIDALGTPATDISGPIAWRDDVIEIAWSGAIVGGRIDAGGTVDLAAARWQAAATAEAPLANVSRALLEILGAPALPGADDGVARASIAAEGWTEATVTADVTAVGDWLGAALAVEDLSLAYDSARGLSLELDGRWGEGPLRLRSEARDGPTDWSAEAGPLRVLGVPVEAFAASWTIGDGPVRGRATARAGEEPWQLAADVVLDAEGLQGFVAGSAWGGGLTGAFATAPTAGAPVEGGVTWAVPAELATGGARVVARVGGDLGAPSFELEVVGDGPVTPSVGGPDLREFLPGLDLRGRATATLAGGVLQGGGRLGPVAFAIDGGDWTADVDALRLAGALRGTVGPVVASGGRDGWTATARTAVASGPPIPGRSEPLWGVADEVAWRIEGGPDGWTARGDDDRWRLSSEAGGAWAVDAAPVIWLDRPATLDGQGTFSSFSATVTLPDLVATAEGDAGSIRAAIRGGGERLEGTWASGGRLDVAGSLDLGIALRGWADVAGVARLAGAWETALDDLPSGDASLALTAPWPAEVALSGDGSTASWDAASDLAGVSLLSSGRWRPGAPEPLAGTLAWGDLALLNIDGDGVSGSGTWSGWGALGVRVAAQDWSLRLSTAGVGEAEFGATRATFDLAEPRLEATIDLGLSWGGRPARVTGRAAWSAERPAGDLVATLELGGGGRASVAGDLDGLAGSFAGPVADWAAVASPLLAADGEAALAGDLTGTLAWSPAASLVLRAGWRDVEDRPVDVTWSPAGGEASGAGWRARLEADGRLEVEAERARLAPLLRRDDLSLAIDGSVIVGLGGAVTGPATGGGDAGGVLDVSAAFGGSELAARLVGGNEPALDGMVSLGPLRAWAEGSLALGPTIAWRGVWRLADEAEFGLAGRGDFYASAAETGLTGALDLPAGELGPLAWPRLAADVDLRPEGFALSGTDGLAGSWPEGLSTTVTLADVPTSVRLGPEGDGWALDADGELVTAAWVGVLEDWSLTGTARLAGVRAFLEAGGSAATASGHWSLAHDSRPGGLAVEPEPWAAGRLTLDDAALVVVARGEDLALARASGIAQLRDPTVQGELRARLAADGWSLDGRLDAAWPPGTGGPVSASLEATGRRLTLAAEAEVAGATTIWSVTGDDLGDGLATRWALGGRVDDIPWSGEARTDAAGVELDVASDDGRWRLVAGGGRTGQATATGPTGLDATLTWRLDPSLEVDLEAQVAGFTAAARVGLPANGGGEGPWLRLDVAHAEEPWRAYLVGPLDPLDLNGAIALTDAGFAARVASSPAWRLTWGGLEVVWEDGDLVVDGRSEANQLPFVELEAAGLRWGGASGWAGRGRLTGTWDAGGLGHLDAVAELAGAGELEALLALTLDGVAIGGASLRVGSDPTTGVGGDAELAVPIPGLASSTMFARGPVGFGASGLEVDLELRLAGPREALGRLTADADAIRARLSGTGIELTSELRGALGEGRLELRELALDEELPYLLEPRLSADADVAWDGAGWSWRVDALRLTTPGSLLEAGGVGGPNGRVEASARVDVDLSDLLLDTSIAGRVRGPVSFDGEIGDPLAGTIAANLEADEVRWDGLSATWRALLTVTGSAGDPLVRADWTADGPDARLGGDAAWWPERSTAELRADGDLFGARVALDVGLTEQRFGGDGEVVVGGETWSVTTDTGRLGVRGTGRWQDWAITLDPAGWRADVTGDLTALPMAGGSVAGTIGFGDGRRPVVDLAWRAASIAGAELGDVRVTGDAVTGWTLSGPRATGSLAPDLQNWGLALDAIALPVGDTSASITARGGQNGVEVAATWVGDTPAGPLDLRIDATGEGARWLGDVTGHAFGGEVAWPLTLDGDALGGSGRLSGAHVAGTPVDATLGLAGTLAEPDLAIAVAAGPDGVWRVAADWRAGVARVDAALPSTDGVPLTVAGQAWPTIDVAIDGGDAGVVRLTGGWRDGALRLTGALDLDLGDLRIEVTEPTAVRVSLPALGGGLATTLPDAPLLDAIAEVTKEGWRWHGTGGWTGSLRVLGPDGAWIVAEGLSLERGSVTATVEGRVDAGAVAASLDVRLDLSRLADDLAFAGAWAWSAPAVGTLRWRDGLLSLRGEAPWGIDATLDPAAAAATVDLEFVGETTDDRPAPSAAGRLTLDGDGWGGALRVMTITDVLGDGPASVALDIAGAGRHLALDASVLGTRGSATAVGRWDAAELLPDGWGAPTVPLRELDLRVVGLDLTGIAGVPGISGDLGGSATLRGDRVFGLLTSEALTYGGRTDPVRLEFQADLAGSMGVSGSARLDLVGANAQVDAGPAGISTLVRLERFPLHAWVEAVVGPSDVRAEVTGAVRGSWAWGAVAPDDLRVAAERIELERAGVVTVGELSVDWDGDSLTLGRAAFEGRGTWQARGRITPELLDLELLAQAADFGPLLGLVPSFARYGVSAEGNLVVTAHGTPASPDVALRTDDLRVLIAGTRYQLQETRFTLRDEDWSGRSEIVAIDPLIGRLELATRGRIGPLPEGGFSLDARAVGDLDVPFVGRVEAITAELAWSDDEAPTLRAGGTLGSPFTIEGPLAPLDLRANGRDLSVTLPFLAIADARVDVDLRLVDHPEGVSLGGRVDASEARIDLETRAAFTAQAASSAPVDGDGPARRDGGPTPVGDPRERFRFEGVRIVAPQRVTFSESIGNAEASVDLSLGGTAAAPRLSGQVIALRGAVRFAGRDLDLTEAVATFDPTRGVYPSVRVGGRTAFDKARVVPPGGTVRFLAPAGQRFEVVLVLEGEAIDGDTGFTLDLTPTLRSDAVVEGLDGGGARPLTELELLTLLTLGRLEAGGGFAGAVAQSALDTAVDVLITGEIQAALAEALGVEVVELRTTALSSLLDGQDPFGVSLRLGGYLSDEVFASYRVSTLGGDAFSNEVALTYQLGPVAMDVTGRFDVAAGAAATGGPSLAIGGRYGLAPGWALELGLDLSTERSTARLGVTWRW